MKLIRVYNRYLIYFSETPPSENIIDTIVTHSNSEKNSTFKRKLDFSDTYKFTSQTLAKSISMSGMFQNKVELIYSILQYYFFFLF